MDPNEFIAFLHRTGHFWNPANADTHNVGAEDVGRLDLHHRYVKDATASWQTHDANFDTICQWPIDEGGHGRALIPDGEIGPVTHRMFGVRRCPIPDWTPPDGAGIPQYSPSQDVQREMESIVDSMRQNATGSGSWPVPGCDPERPNREREHSVRVNLDTSSASSHQASVLREALALVEQCEAEIGQSVRHILDGDPAAAEHDIRFEYIPGGVIGYNYFPIPGTCQQVVKGRIDNSYNQDAHAIATLFTHEYKGHGDGLQHTRGGIMNPSLLRIHPLSWRGDPHERTKARYFGGEPIRPPEPPEPPGPGPRRITVAVNGELELHITEAEQVRPVIYPKH